MEVIPLDENSIMCDIEASLVLPTDYKWIVIKLDSVYKHFFTELYNAKLMNPDALREISKIKVEPRQKANFEFICSAVFKINILGYCQLKYVGHLSVASI
ncbi:hypothetical protein NQ317_011753 [Molorchus minor]|uniref:Uncharacterized protein n=1 Tax=Molorchus minor TaxID=1323400 RepID=A0ABQ9JVU9_9CUCU|nr:hypothetical protein NQ317_011753 [Molorchus minor]